MPCGFEVERTIREVRAEKAHCLGIIRSQRRPVFAVSGTGYCSQPRPRLVDGLEILSHILDPELSPAPLSSNVVKRVSL